MPRPLGPVATAAWRKFADARAAHFRGELPASALHAAANQLNAWAETVDPRAGADFGSCPDLVEFDVDAVLLEQRSDAEAVFA